MIVAIDNNDLQLDVIIFVGFEILITIISTCISAVAVLNICCAEHNHNINDNNAALYDSLLRSIKTTTISAILSYNLCVTLLLIWDLFIIFSNNEHMIIAEIVITLDCLSRILFQITFIFRLKICFDGTSYALSMSSIYTLYIAIALLVIPAIGLLLSIVNLRWYAAILWLFCDWSISMRMSWLFLYKLYQVMYRSALNSLPKITDNHSPQASAQREEKESTTNIASVHLHVDELVSRENLQQLDLITLMTKYTVLVSIAYLSNLANVIIIFIIRSNYNIELIFYQHSQYFEHFIITTNVLICVLCLYLSYAFNNKYYHLICSAAHKLCNNCCIHCISQKMKNDIATQQLL